MKRPRISFKPTTTGESLANWEDLYENLASDWTAKAERLQARRWRKLMRVNSS